MRRRYSNTGMASVNETINAVVSDFLQRNYKNLGDVFTLKSKAVSSLMPFARVMYHVFIVFMYFQ